MPGATMLLRTHFRKFGRASIADDRITRVCARAALVAARSAVFAGVLMSATVSTPTDGVAQDTVRVRSTAAPVWGPKVKLTVFKDIGQADGPDEYSFGSVGAVTFDRTGRMYVYDEQDKILRAYDANARYVRTIGRFGEGPGEFKDATDVTFVDDTVLAIRDASVSRVSLFYPDGKLKLSVTNPGFAKVGFNDFTVDRDGLITYSTWRTDPALEKGARGMDRLRYNQLIRVRQNGNVVDSLKIPTKLPYDDATMFMIASWGAGNNFVAQSHWAVLKSGGFVFGDGNAMRFMIRPSRGPVRIVERNWKPVALGREERANWLEFASYMATLPQGVGGTGKPRDFRIPATKPAFKGIFTDEDSRIWISVYAPAHKVVLPPRPASNTSKSPRLVWRQPETYDVFSDKGEYLGRVEMPDGQTIGNARGNRLWTVTGGPNDELIIRVYTMSGSAALKP